MQTSTPHHPPQTQPTQTWHKRYCTLTGGTLRWLSKPGGDEKGYIDVRGSTILCPEDGTPKRKAYITVRSTDRDLQMHGGSDADVEGWLAALRRAAALPGAPVGAGRVSSTGSSGSAGGGGGGGGGGGTGPGGRESDKMDAPAVDDDSPGGGAPLAEVAAALPSVVEVDGVPEVGAELRVRVSVMRAVDSLSVAWFRYTGDAPPEAVSDIVAHAGTKVISGATGGAYTVTPADVGCRLGVIVRPPVKPVSRWAIASRRVVAAAAADASTPRLRLAVAGHEHNKYCDRRVRVCTAMARVREGNTLYAVVAGGGSEALAGAKVAWYRSGLVDAQLLGAVGVAASGAAAHETGAALPSPDPAAPDGWDAPATAPLHAGGVAADAHVSRLWPALATATYSAYTPRSPADLPPCPPDYVPSAGVPDTRRHMALLAVGRAVAPTTAPTAADAAGGVPGAIPAAASVSGALRCPLFREDIGRLVTALLLAPDAPVPPAIAFAVTPAAADAPPFTPPTVAVVTPGTAAAPAGLLAWASPAGPVEAAPPKAREIWIEGAPVVGCLLVGNVYYYGGYAGMAEVAWVAINDDGETIDLKGPARVDICAPLPELDTELGALVVVWGWGVAMPSCISHLALPYEANAGSAVDDDPRVLRLTTAHAGCLIKYKVKPIRSDGDDGHAESSRPTAEVVVADADTPARVAKLAADSRGYIAAAAAAVGAAADA